MLASKLTQTYIILPEKFQELNEYLWSQNWLIHYEEPEYINNVLNSMTRRHLKLVNFLIGSFDDFILHYTIFLLFWGNFIQQ